ncbi:MAG: NADH-quinone oxidoreductase subunit NuoE [Planctomycetota bacterium]
MAWNTIDRGTVADARLGPGISAAAKQKITTFFERYPTKRAALLPALHIIQDEIGYISIRAMREVAELLGIAPSDVMDVVTFYTHFWTHPRGTKTIVVCRSLTCELMGGRTLLEVLKEKLGIDEHETTPDGKYSLMTEECLAACDYGPCMLINEKLHKRVTLENLDRILSDPYNDKLEVPRSDLFDAPRTAKPE